MIVKLLAERHLEFISLKEGCRGSSESIFDKMSNFWKSHAAAYILYGPQCENTFLQGLQLTKAQTIHVD